jgi:hypothetical protein
MGIVIGSGNVVINGRSMNGGSGADWAEQSVGGVNVKFQTGADLRMRQVQIEGMTTVLSAGSSVQMQVNGISVRSQGNDLWINGQQVDLTGGAAPADGAEKKQSAKETLEARFPGVLFTNHNLIQIEGEVQIAAGARVDGGSSGTFIADSTIGSNAQIAGGNIRDSTVHGIVRDASVSDSTIAHGGVVSDATVKDTTVASGAGITGGNVKDVIMKSGASISGGNVKDMVLEEGASVSGGNLKNFTLKAGESITSGNHKGGVNESKSNAVSISIQSGNFLGDGNVFIGNVSQGLSVIGNANNVQISTSGGRVVIGDNIVIN